MTDHLHLRPLEPVVTGEPQPVGKRIRELAPLKTPAPPSAVVLTEREARELAERQERERRLAEERRQAAAEAARAAEYADSVVPRPDAA